MAEQEEKSRILVVDDNQDLRLLMVMTLEPLGYEFIEAADGKEALALAFTRKPDLILLDREMPVMGGMEALAELRSNLLTRHIPVIMVTSLGDVEDRVQGLQRGSDDYIVKPFDPDELMARVVGLLRRTRGALAADPLTKLPGNFVLREELLRRMRSDRPFSIAYLDLNHFKAYVDHCGFERASQVIQTLARILYNALVDKGAPEDFIGHIGGDDFLLLADQERAGQLCESVLQGFDENVPSFYEKEDVERGYIEGMDRYGTLRKFPLLSLSIAVLDVAPGDFEDREDLGTFASKCKEEVKSKGGSVWKRFSRPRQPVEERA